MSSVTNVKKQEKGRFSVYFRKKHYDFMAHSEGKNLQGEGDPASAWQGLWWSGSGAGIFSDSVFSFSQRFMMVGSHLCWRLEANQVPPLLGSTDKSQ